MSGHTEFINPNEVDLSLVNRGYVVDGSDLPIESNHAVMLGDLDAHLAFEGTNRELINALTHLIEQAEEARKYLRNEIRNQWRHDDADSR